jgi:hypothetical protein
VQRYRETTSFGAPSSCAFNELARKNLPPSGKRAELPWFALAVKVTRDRVVAFCDDSLVGEVDLRQLAPDSRTLLRSNPIIDDDFAGITTTDGACGLYLSCGGASYREAVVTPLEQ